MLPHLLFVNKSHSVVELDPRLQLRMQPAQKEGRVVWPTEPWESWAVFAYNHVVSGDKASGRPHRMYYDCIEGAGVPPGGAMLQEGTISHRRICLAESNDGLVWTKPILGLYNRSGSTRNNILLEDSGVSVFFDGRPGTPANASWKMVCSNAAYASPDGLRWRRLPFRPIATDDTKPTAYYDPALGKYVISVRRDLPPFKRTIGRCVTDNISDWQAEVPLHGGCAVVFHVDESDPQALDVYTNAVSPNHALRIVVRSPRAPTGPLTDPGLRPAAAAVDALPVGRRASPPPLLPCDVSSLQRDRALWPEQRWPPRCADAD